MEQSRLVCLAVKNALSGWRVMGQITAMSATVNNLTLVARFSLGSSIDLNQLSDEAIP
ncbi:MAG: hypothetical protein AAFU71_13870 [Cyanobacteria bacterium J06632_22]